MDHGHGGIAVEHEHIQLPQGETPDDVYERIKASERMRREVHHNHLDPDTIRRHREFHEKHKGHEQMHAEMFLILIVTLIVAQIVLVEWKKRHYKSYMLSTLTGMFLVPLCFCGYNRWFRFVCIWIIFAALTSYIVKRALEKPLNCRTPRLVYKWFYLIHKVSYGMGIVGYCIMMATMFGVNFIFGVNPHSWMDCATLLLFYGIYYGVLGRDLAEICSDQMAVKIGYYAKEGFPSKTPDSNVCAICGNVLLVKTEEEGVIEDTFQLSCGHVFHEFCIRGWCIVGKKQTCPFCGEKVDLKQLVNFWEKPHLLYGQLLDWVRWLVAWQPVLYFFAQGINWTLGLH